MSGGNGASSATDRIAQVEQRRAERAEAREKARLEQYAQDLEAIEALEADLGVELDTVRVAIFKDGLPAVVGVKTPDPREYKRYFDSLQRAGNADARTAAFRQIAETAWKYPADDAAKKAMLEAHSSLLVAIGNRAIKLAEQHAADEGKG